MVTSLRSYEPPPAFTTALHRLEERGVALLLVGEVDDAAMRAVIRRMVGDPTRHRYRVLALLGGADPARYLPGDVTAGRADVSVLRYPFGRSAATAETSVDRSVGAGGILDAMHQDLRRTYDVLARQASATENRPPDEFEPGELRVVVDSLQPLVDAAGVDGVLEWLRTDPIRLLREPRFRGRSHWVYHGPVDDPVVETLMADPGVFDVLVRVQRRQRLVEYRWVLRSDRFPHLATRIETPWMPVEP